MAAGRIDWLSIWALARCAGVPSDEFWDLTIAELAALLRAAYGSGPEQPRHKIRDVIGILQARRRDHGGV